MAENLAGQGMLGVDQLQRQVDALTASVGQLSANLSDFVTRITSALSAASNATAGAASASSGIMAGQTAGRATGTGTGGYAAMAPSGAPAQTMGTGANGATPVGSSQGSGGSGSGGGGRFRRFLSFGSSRSGQGPSSGAMGSGAKYTAIGAGVVQAAAMYGSSHLNTFLTMNTIANQQVMNSGLQNGGYAASVRTATSMIYGSGGRNLNVTAASVADAAQAAGTLSYALGAPMYNANGTPNAAWVAGQSSMYQMGYANPTMSQAAVAGAMASVYSPRSAMMMSALGYGSSIGVGGARASMSSIANQVFSRTFQGQSGAISSTEMAAALSQGGSLDSNLRYLASQSGWTSSTVGMMEGYLKDRNIALGKGVTSSQFDALMTKASTGDKNAQKQLDQYGIGASTVQSLKDLQGAQSATLADQSGPYNDALEQSTQLLTAFNRALGSILNNTGLDSLIGGASGYATPFGSAAAGIGSLAGLAGMGGGSGLFGSVASTLGMGVMGRGAGGLARVGVGAAGSLAGKLGFGGGEGAAGMPSLLSRLTASGPSLMTRLGAAGAGVGVTYAGVNANNALWNHVGHSGSGDDWVTDVGKGAGNTLAWAGGGALVGTAILPGVGTLVGAGIGGAIGLGQSVWDWWRDKKGYSARSGAATNSASVPGGYSSGIGNIYTPPAASVNNAPVVRPAVGVNPLLGGLSMGGGLTTGSIGGGTDNGTLSASGPSSVTPAKGASGASAATLQKVVAAGVNQVGKPYVYGAAGPDSFDCSGLTQFSYAQGGIHIPRTSEQQMTAGSPVKPEDAMPGDLLFPYPGHVMMCIGGGQVVEARHTGTTVWIRSYKASEFVACRRIIQLASEGGSQNAAAAGGNGATGASPATSASVTGTGLAAGTSELDAIKANAQSATTDKLTASLRLTASLTPFGLSSSTQGDPLLNPLVNGSTLASGKMTATNKTVKDIYGHVYSVPSGEKPPGNVASWISQALSDMGMAPSWTADVRDIINGESGGDPWSINLTDSNAAHGTPSEGIMQTIPGTFAAHKMSGHPDIWDPVDNIIAGVRYAIGRYKSLDNVPGVQAVKAGKPYVGYAAGAWELPADQIAQLHKGEMVLPATSAQSVRNAVIADALGSSRTAGASAGSGGVTLHFRPGSIQISMGQVSAQTARDTGTAIVDSIVSDPRIKKMAVGL